MVDDSTADFKGYRIYYWIADFEEVLTKDVMTNDIEEYCEYFQGGEEDISIDYWEILTDRNSNED